MIDSAPQKNIRSRLVTITILAITVGCQMRPNRTTSSTPDVPSPTTGEEYNVEVGKGEGLSSVPGVECSKPIDKHWPKVTVHIPNNDTDGDKDVTPKSVDIEILSNMNQRLKNFTMLKGQKTGTLALKPIMDKGPLQIRISQNFEWNHGRKKHPIQNIIFYGTVDRENICLNLPDYKTVKATIKLGPSFMAKLKKDGLDLSKGYIEAKNQLGELSVDMKVKYDSSRTMATEGIPNVWKTDLLMNANGGEVTFTPAPWSTKDHDFKRQNGVSVKVSPKQREVSVEISK